MHEELPLKLAEFEGKGYVIAPAGYGKTHLIALAVKASTRRQLVLTHTYAGVSAIKKKMQSEAVPTALYQIDTIASWALRLCLYFPKTSGWATQCPNGQQWGKLYEATALLLNRPFVERVVRNSYAGVYVDEYQDCATTQHSLVEALARLLPCRVLGDPMQAIFDFKDRPVDWDEHIFPNYQLLGKLQKPWRWHAAGAPELGAWLDTTSQSLRAGKKISLAGPLPKGVHRVAVDLMDFKDPRRLNLFFSFLEHEESVIAIYSGNARSKSKTHQLAMNLRGRFSSLEEVEGKVLFRFVTKLEAAATVKEKLCGIIEFTKSCCNAVDGILSASTKRGEHAKASKATKYPEVLQLANGYLADPSSHNLTLLLMAIQANPETSVYRRDLFNRFMKILRIHVENRELSLLESAQTYQREFRHSGRPIRHNRLIGTTLLVKGLEYDHAIILEAESMSPKDLYVALTRGAKSITIVSLSNSIPA